MEFPSIGNDNFPYPADAGYENPNVHDCFSHLMQDQQQMHADQQESYADRTQGRVANPYGGMVGTQGSFMRSGSALTPDGYPEIL